VGMMIIWLGKVRLGSVSVVPVSCKWM